MKKLFYFFCLLCGVVGNFNSLQAQIVNIPDANFKMKLVQLGVDTNSDGVIQVAEAQVVTSLYIGPYSIHDLTGIEAFVNLTQLTCNSNPLTSLDLSNNINLTSLTCSSNQLTSLNVSGNINLGYLDCCANQLTGLNVSTNVNLLNLLCYSNQLTSLGTSNNVSLKFLYCDRNNITNLNLSNNASLTTLNCSSNLLTSLNISNLLNLQTLDCSFNQLTNLDVSNNGSLLQLSCDGNQLANLDVSNNGGLAQLYCSDNQLTNLNLSNNGNLQQLSCHTNLFTSLDVSINTHLWFLNCSANQLTSLDLVNNANLQTLSCKSNQLTSLDLSSNISLQSLACDTNQLAYLIVKNGRMENTFTCGSNPNLTYICADYFQLADVQNKLQQQGMTNVFVSTLCTYAPGGISYNTLSGKSFIDLDMNGCAPNDSTFPFTFISVNNGTNTYYTCSTQAGDYLAYLSYGNFVIIPEIINSPYFSVDTANISFPNNNNNVQTQDLCITPNGVFPDVEISLIPLNPARPGFDANYQIQYKNIGTTTANGDITLDFQGNKMNFVSASVSPMNQTASQLTWNYNGLQPLEMRIVGVKMHILPPPTNNINDVITFHANISLANDADSSNNNASVTQTLVGSFDPNDKTCLEGKLLYNDKIGDYLHYLIRFQNTGNYPAENVVVIDTLDAAKYDLASLQILETSHNAHIDLKSNVLQFYFENIQLADSFSNEPASHGFVVYKIKTKSTLPLNSTVKNKAEIYFDYNFPVITNLETTTFSSFTGVEYPAQKPHFQCYPNPAQNILTIETPNKADFLLFNTMGEMLREITVNSKENIDISFLPKGMYLLRAKNAGTGISFVKE